MKLTLSEPKFLKDSISIISDLVSEGTFKITPDAIQLIAMDPANVAMVIFKLLSSSFEEYNVKEDVSLSINLNDFKQVLRRAKANDAVTLEIEESKFKVTFKSNATRTFFLPLIDIEEKQQKIPDLKFKATITTNSTIINEAIEDVDIIGESVTFIAENQELNITAAGDLSKANINIKADKDTKIVVDKKVKSKFSIEYLKKMIQGGKLSDKVVLQLSDDYPMKLEYKVLNKVQLAFILAPRVDND
ncbi:MAG: proliferating cell nuclear antigen (pcna) [Nanoarchaeota archaeon]|nr:proliferating cell nuclear antigen (pcna) [Nanoarchaeota archaeon]MBU1269309.1 proliferating cell nuclear antigen (pcna) [Nanoarchaeota archaeon]MBU1603753.1 proliferating cell nuclear antigen (pcna) [Nanoarchaeota archaeon]MBU2443879.1 proliferating cell nuclear antigen (pcna) [Nanoarchaeota archaeon]